MGSDQIAIAHFIGASLDHGNVVGIEVADHQLAAIRLEGQVHGCAANVHRGQELGVFQVHGGNFACTRASDKSLAAVLEYRNVFGLLTAARLLRSEEHTSELQSPDHLVCRLLLEKKKLL